MDYQTHEIIEASAAAPLLGLSCALKGKNNLVFEFDNTVHPLLLTLSSVIMCMALLILRRGKIITQARVWVVIVF